MSWLSYRKARQRVSFYSEYDEQFQAVALLVVLFLIVEVCILEAKNPRLKNVRIFKAKPKVGKSDIK